MSGITITRYSIQDASYEDRPHSLIYYDAKTAEEALTAYCQDKAKAAGKILNSVISTARAEAAETIAEAGQAAANVIGAPGDVAMTVLHGRTHLAVPVSVVCSGDSFPVVA